MQLNSTLWCPPGVISRESLSGKFGVSQCGAFEYYILELPQCLAISGKVELFLHFRDDRKILSVEHCPLCFEKLLSGIHMRKHRFVKDCWCDTPDHCLCASLNKDSKEARWLTFGKPAYVFPFIVKW